MTNITREREVNYMHEEHDFNDFNIQPLLPHKLSQYGPGLSVGDANNDGLDDIYIAGAFEFSGTFLIQQQDGTFSRRNLLEGTDPKNREEEMGSLFFDADGDGDDDLYVASGGYEHEYGDKAYQDRLFINEGGKLRLAEDALPNYFLASGLAARAADFDRDGDLDLFVGGRVYPHQYPKPVDSYMLENVSEEGSVKFEIVNKQKAPVLNKIGMISDALWTDFNNDGWTDLVLAGEWMSLRFLKNESGQFRDVTESTGIAGVKGWWNSLCAADFDRDGDTDYIAGNLGTNTHYKASEEQPLRIYGNDFDKNGRYDAIPTLYVQNRQGQRVEVPYHIMQDLRKQVPPAHDMFNTYSAYAQSTMSDILAKFDTTGTLVERADYMKSSLVENNGDGTFSISPLPGKVQWAPVNGCITEDVNQDGNPDVMLVANDYGTEISTGRYDALNGLVLMGDGDGNFEVQDFKETGFFVPGDAKALVKLRGANDEYLLAASQNRGPLELFRNNGSSTSRLFKAQPMDASATVKFIDGSSRKVEFYYGSTFLSSSARFLPLGENVASIEITSYDGTNRTINIK